MVSKIAAGYSADVDGKPFRRRRLLPGLIVLAVLAVFAVAAWTYAIRGNDVAATPVDCPMPNTTGTAPAPTLTKASHDELLAVAPAPLSTFRVQVLNSSGQQGEARRVSERLVAAGFIPTDPAYADDPLYADQDLDCVAQIRFGPQGQGAAAAAWLAQPCAQLIDDGREGTDVDLVLGVHYQSEPLNQDTQAALDALRSADPNNPKTGADRALIEAVHSQPC